MTQLRRLFSEHPASVGETYVAHLLTASLFALRLVGAGLVCLVHAILPFLFVHTGSRCVLRLNAELIERNRARDDRYRASPKRPKVVSPSP